MFGGAYTVTEEQKKLVENNTWLVKFAMTGLHYTRDISEFASLGYYELYKAALNYNPQRAQFSTYAYKCLRSAYIRQLSINNKKKEKEVNLYNTLSHDIDEDIILADTFVDESENVEKNGISKRTYEEIIKIAQNKLTKRELEILEAIQNTKNNNEAARLLGVTKQRVHQKLKTIREKILKEYNK